MRTTRPWLDELPPAGTDPLGTAARLRLARLDPDVLTLRATHVAVDLAVLSLLLAVPALASLAAMVVAPAPAVVTTAALTLGCTSVLVGFAVLWPHHDGGRTAGMRWVGLRVVDGAGHPPSRSALLLRAVVLPLDVWLGPVLVLVRADRRRLGDLLTGTQVVRDLGAGTRPADRPGPARAPRPRSHAAAAAPRA